MILFYIIIPIIPWTYIQNNTCRNRKQFWTSLPSIKWSVRNMLKETVYLQIPYLPKRKGSFKTVTYDMSNMFWPTWAIDLFAKNVAIMGPGYVARVARNALSQMSNRLKMAKARFPVTHWIMGTPLTLFKMWDVCPIQGCKCTHMPKAYYGWNILCGQPLKFTV